MTPQLRDEQDKIVQEVRQKRVTVVSAGAGTGKTFTTVATVLMLLEEPAQPPISLDQFVLITFSRKAATELRLRMAKALRDELEAARRANDLTAVRKWRQASERLGAAYIGTFHSFCRRLLRTYGYPEYVARESEVSFSSHLRDKAFEQTRKKLRNGTPESNFVCQQLFEREQPLADYQLRDLVFDIIDYVRNRNLSLDKIVRLARKRNPTDTNRQFSLAIAFVAQWTLEFFDQCRLSEQRMDSYDLLARAAKLLENAQVRQRVAQRYRYLFIDEFQDTDALQKKLVESLSEGLKKLVVVGDKKQSIYYFRGARHDFLEEIAQKFHVATLPLRTSGRARPEVIEVQNQLFASMAQGEAGWPDLNEPLQADPQRQEGLTISNGLPPLRYISASQDRGNRDMRVNAAIQAIQGLITHGFKYGDIALLFRGNASMLRYLDALHLAGIPARSSLGESFYIQPEIVTVYRMLRCILQPDDDAALALALHTPVMQAVRDRNVEKNLLQLGQIQQSLTAWFNGPLPLSVQHGMSEKLRILRRELLEDTVPSFLGRLYRDLDFAQAFHNDAVVARNLDHLREIARNLVEEEEAITVEMFTNVLQTYIEQEAREETIDPPPLPTDPKPSYVRLMTVHAAKGLEFPVVIIPEVQADLVRDNEHMQPDFVVQNDLSAVDVFGLDINPRLSGTRQAHGMFNQRQRMGQRDRLEEEMRLLYVALTRTREIAVLIGAGQDQPRARENNYYSWQDEILRARGMLSAAGAQFN